MNFSVRNTTRNLLLASNVERADTILSRMIGLLGRRTLPQDCGLWITSFKSIHTHFMRFSIDAVFISAEGKVVQMYEHLKPFRITSYVKNAADVLELPEGTLTRCSTKVGDQLLLERHPQ